MTAATRGERLAPARTALLVIDAQERLAAAMSDEITSRVVRNTKILIDAAARLGVPIVVSEQYPSGLGATVPELAAALAAVPPANVHRFEKLEFSAVSTGKFARLRTGVLQTRDQWIVAGMEAHVCVYQSVRDLVPAHAVHVAADAVCSRTKQNWRAGLDLMDRLGAIISTTEICVFDLLERAGTDTFKALSRTLK